MGESMRASGHRTAAVRRCSMHGTQDQDATLRSESETDTLANCTPGPAARAYTQHCRSVSSKDVSTPRRTGTSPLQPCRRGLGLTTVDQNPRTRSREKCHRAHSRPPSGSRLASRLGLSQLAPLLTRRKQEESQPNANPQSHLPRPPAHPSEHSFLSRQEPACGHRPVSSSPRACTSWFAESAMPATAKSAKRESTEPAERSGWPFLPSR